MQSTAINKRISKLGRVSQKLQDFQDCSPKRYLIYQKAWFLFVSIPHVSKNIIKTLSYVFQTCSPWTKYSMAIDSNGLRGKRKQTNTQSKHDCCICPFYKMFTFLTEQQCCFRASYLTFLSSILGATGSVTRIPRYLDAKLISLGIAHIFTVILTPITRTSANSKRFLLPPRYFSLYIYHR